MEFILTGKKTFKSIKPVDLSICTKKEIIDYFNNSYDVYESIFLGLKDESVFYTCPDRLRLPLVFYYAHTAVVFMNKLMLAGLVKERVSMPFETMFETGVDEMSWDDTENFRMGGSYQWPPMKDIVDYRRKVRELILDVIQETPLDLPITMESPWWAVVMGIEHERVHLETSAVLIRQLPIHLVNCPTGWKYGPVQADNPVKSNRIVSVPFTKVTMGKPFDFPSFGWDNEYGEAVLKVPAFEASQYLVTNSEFLEFVKAGGYENSNHWTEEGWQWVQFREAKHPTFWVCDQGCKSGCGAALANETHCLPYPALIDTNGDAPDCKRARTDDYRYRLIFDVIDLPLDWPVEVNYHEAKAFCAWKGQDYRVLTEAEQLVIRGPEVKDVQRQTKKQVAYISPTFLLAKAYGGLKKINKQLPTSKGTECDIIFRDNIPVNLNLQYGSSTPVNMYDASATGHYDTYGNVAEWVEDHFNGLPGFHTHIYYDDFSTPCFDGKHNLIMGGSWMSTGAYGSRFARIAFRRHFFQFCGFRLAKSKALDSDIPARVVDTEVYVLGVGVEDNKTGNIGKQKPISVTTTNSAYSFDTQEVLEGILELEFGFRDSFAASIAKACQSYCKANNVDMGSVVHIGSATGRAAFELSRGFKKVFGMEICSRLIDAALNLKDGQPIYLKNGKPIEIDSHVQMNRVNFMQLTWIANEVESHDVVLLTLLDRVQNGKAWLLRLWEITKTQGIVAIATRDGSWSKETLEHLLENRLKCVAEQMISFEGERTTSMTIWKRAA